MMQASLYRWLWGLPIVLAIWLVSFWAERGAIEQDLKQRAELAFRQAGLDWAQAGANGLEVALLGEAYSEQERHLARRLIAKTHGVWNVVDHSALAEIEADYIWTAAIEDDALRISGYYPNRQAHAAVITVARRMFPDRQLADNMQPARGAPSEDVWLGAIHFGLDQLSRLKQGGQINLRGTELAVAGVANSVSAYRTIKGALYRRVPSGVLLVNDKVAPPVISPFTWSADYKDSQLVLSGYVPGDRERDTLIAAAKAAFKQSPIVDKMAVAGGAPLGWLGTARAVVRELSKLVEGSATITDAKASISGIAQKQETAEDVRSALKGGLPKQFLLQHKITYREATIPTVSPFVTTIVSDGKGLSLSGYTPDKAQSSKIVATVKQRRPNMTVVDAMAIAKGAPEGWSSCMRAGLDALLQLENGRVELSGTTLLVTGLTRDETIGEALPKQVREAANRACTDTVNLTVEIPPEPNLTWTVEAADKTITLAGQVPNSAVEEALVKTAKGLFPKSQLQNNMTISPASSKKWPKVALVTLNMLSKLRLGSARLEGQSLAVSGEAPDTATASAIKEQLKASMPKGYRALADIEVKSAAMLWAEREAKRKEREAADAAKEEAERARKLREEQEIKRKAEEAAHLVREREEKRKAEEAAELARQAEQRRKVAEAARIALEEANKRKAEAAARQAQIREQELCQKAIDDAIQSGTITFARGSATLDKQSYPTLDKLVGLKGFCQRIHIEIAGHTDSSGSESGNQNLSELRAKSVMSYLIAGGIPSAQLSAKGYGETQPLVPNTSARNRARNRRIEFKVRIN